MLFFVYRNKLIIFEQLCWAGSLRNDSCNEARLSRTGNNNGGQNNLCLRYFLGFTVVDVDGICHVVSRIRQTTPGSATRYTLADAGGQNVTVTIGVAQA